MVRARIYITIDQRRSHLPILFLFNFVLSRSLYYRLVKGPRKGVIARILSSTIGTRCMQRRRSRVSQVANEGPSSRPHVRHRGLPVLRLSFFHPPEVGPSCPVPSEAQVRTLILFLNPVRPNRVKSPILPYFVDCNGYDEVWHLPNDV